MNDNYKKVNELKEYIIKKLTEIDNIRINSPINDKFTSVYIKCIIL